TAWGNNRYGQCNVPASLTNVVAIAAGDRYSFALRSDGTVVEWGDNYFGQNTVPAGLTNVVAIAAGRYHSLALVGHGKPWISDALLDRFGLAGGTVYFRSSASGARPLSYQWQLDGTNLPNATNTILVLTNIQVVQSGAYSLTVTNSL